MGALENLDRWLPDPETWDLPDRLSPDACRDEIGGVGDPIRPEEEEEAR